MKNSTNKAKKVKSNNITKVFLIISSILILFLEFPVFIINTSTTDSIDNSETPSEFEIKASYSSSPIIIDDSGGGDYTWGEAIGQPWCSGAGTSGNPYVVKDLVIDGGFSPGDSCLEIRNSNAYFRVENCDLFNAGPDVSGLLLYNVINGEITGCDCSGNSYFGISLFYSDNITISGNTVNNNVCGIYLYDSDLNKIIGGNTVTSNDYDGLLISNSLNNIVSGNTFNNNFGDGIQLDYAHNTIISGNSITNNDDDGLYCYYSDNVDIINGNTINLNTWDGIWSDGCYNINISGNTVNSNDYVGIDLKDNHYITAKSNIVSLNADDGFWFGECTHLDVSDNTANSNDGIGINIVDSDHGIISDNDANSNLVVGILVRDGINFTVDLNTAEYNVLANIATMGTSNCTFMSNIGRFSPAGIGLNDSTDIVIKQNTLEYNEYGIVFLYSDNNRIINNDVNYNTECGIQLNYSNSNTISGNTLNLNFDTYEEIGSSGNSISGTIGTGNIQWTSAGTYKGITIKTPSLPDRPNPAPSDYMIVISPLLAQATCIEKLKQIGYSNSIIESYLQNTYLPMMEEAITATLYMHQNAYIYIMDQDLVFINDENKLETYLSGVRVNSLEKSANDNTLDRVITSLGTIFSTGQDSKPWNAYKALLQNKVFDIRTSNSSSINLQILGNAIEFPEFYKLEKISGGDIEYFSDISYLISGDIILGGIGRIPIDLTQNYYEYIKDINFQKISYTSGSDLLKPPTYQDNYATLSGINDLFEDKSYPTGNLQYNDVPINYEDADIVISGYHGSIINGPMLGNTRAYTNLNPSLLIGYSCRMSNTYIYYDYGGFFIKAYGESQLNRGVTLVGNTIEGVARWYGTKDSDDDSRALTKEYTNIILNGKYSTIGEVHNVFISNNLDNWLALEMTILGDPGLDISNFDDPYSEDIEMLPSTFSTNFSIDYQVESLGSSDILSLNILSTESSIKSMENYTTQVEVAGGELMIPCLNYNVELYPNQTISDIFLTLMNNITISFPNPTQAENYILTEGGAIAVPNINLEGKIAYPRIKIQVNELPWKKIYKIQVFPAIYNETDAEFELSRDIKFQFNVQNQSLATNASLDFKTLDFSPTIVSNQNYTISMEFINSIYSIENATMVNVTLNLPSDLTIINTDGSIQGNSIDWNYNEIDLYEYLTVEYASPLTIGDNYQKDIEIVCEYLSDNGNLYNSFTENISILYLADDLCNLKVTETSITPQIEEGEQVEIQFKVVNDGKIKLGNIPVVIYLNETMIFSNKTSSLASGESFSFEFSYTIEDAGDYTITIVIPEIDFEYDLDDNYNSSFISVEAAEKGGAVKDEDDDDNGKKTKEDFDIALLVLIIIGVSLGAGVTGIIIIKKRIAGKKRIKEIRRIEEINRE